MKKKPKQHNKKTSKKKSTAETTSTSWVDNHLDWLNADDGAAATPDISIVCWNVLADSYCSYRSHQHLPLRYQRHVFDRHQRQHHVRQTLRRLSSTVAPDLVALQEVDPPLEVASCMKELGYLGIETPTSPGGKDTRVDACALYYRQENWKCVDHEIVRLDDLAILCSKNNSEQPSIFGGSNLSGVQTSFVRKNMAILVRLENLQSNRQIVVAVLHLYWNPAYEYVKVRRTVNSSNDLKAGLLTL